MDNPLLRLLNPQPMQYQQGSGAMPVMPQPQMQPQSMQGNKGMNFMRDLVAGALLSYGGAGVSPVILGQQQRRKREEEMLAQGQQQAQLNATKQWLKAQGREDLLPLVDAGQAGAALQMATQRPDVQEPPTSVQEYNYARENGFEGSFMDFFQMKKDGVNVTVNNPGENAYDKKLGEAQADRFTGIQTEGSAGMATQNTLSAMKQLASNPGFYSGTGGEAALAAKRLAVSIGLDPNGVESMEAFNALAKQAAISSMGGSLGAGFSNADRDFVMGQVPSLTNTPPGNAKIIDIQGKIAQRKVEIAQLARDYAARNNGRLDYRFDDELKKWAEANPLFPASGVGAAAGGGDLPQGVTEEDVQFTMQKHGLSREEVLRRLKR